jgi:hypothetical protein
MGGKEYFVRAINLELQYAILSPHQNLTEAFKVPTAQIQEIKEEK